MNREPVSIPSPPPNAKSAPPPPPLDDILPLPVPILPLLPIPPELEILIPPPPAPIPIPEEKLDPSDEEEIVLDPTTTGLLLCLDLFEFNLNKDF